MRCRARVRSHRVAIFNPAGNTFQASRLRVVNPGEESAEVSIAELKAMVDSDPRTRTQLTRIVSALAVRETRAIPPQWNTRRKTPDGVVATSPG